MQRILIADLSESFTEVLAGRLSRYEVHTCHSGAEALTLTDQLRPDVLVIALSLPGIDGLSVLQQIDCKPSVIIALTNFVSEKVVQTVSEVGVDLLVPVPCSIAYVAESIEQLLTSKKLPSLEV